MDDLVCQDRWATRARWMYLRARNVGFELLRSSADGFDDARAGGLPAFERWLDAEFDDAEQAPALLWTGYSWGSAINVSLEDPELIADLGMAKALVQRSVELDPRYYNAAGLTFLGYAEAGFPEALGGNPEAGQRSFERALTLTERHALIIQVNYAKSYAVATGNRELFVQLLEEVVNATDQGNEVRLSNKIAQRRARRYLANIDQYF
jgi:hypothetical protein